MMADASNSNGTPRYKVGKVINRYSLDGMGRELEEYWVGDAKDSYSLRELAEYFNKEVLRSALAGTSQQRFSGDIETIYHALTDDDVSRGEQTRVRKTLERDSIDVEQLQNDFVTHQAIHTYLTKGRDVEKGTEAGDRIESAQQTINGLRGRLIAVVETVLSNLRDTDTLTLGSFDILVKINVHCTDCGTHKNLTELLSDGGCECEDGQ
ncbi:rod-determining factor RdfA [Natrinema limicola]|nr:rod-determining factor RdfA [Natrinema limicola]SET94468.1 hypothetical protein SAMN04488694_1193 [Natrinema hispanicum]